PRRGVLQGAARRSHRLREWRCTRRHTGRSQVARRAAPGAQVGLRPRARRGYKDALSRSGTDAIRIMRIVAGIARGRRLRAPKGRLVRPTADRVKEAVFSMLESRDGCAGRTVLDLFAGAGTLGIEALSRGAESAVFVEPNRAAAKAIRENLGMAGFEGEVIE